MDKEKPIIKVVCGIIRRNGLYFIARRKPEKSLGGFWEFPGGKRNPGETYERCLARELMEELGIVVEVGALYEEVDHVYPGKRVHIRFYRVRWIGNEPRALGCAAFEWVTRGDLVRFEFPAADARLLERLAKDERVWDASTIGS